MAKFILGGNYRQTAENCFKYMFILLGKWEFYREKDNWRFLWTHDTTNIHSV